MKIKDVSIFIAILIVTLAITLTITLVIPLTLLHNINLRNYYSRRLKTYK